MGGGWGFITSYDVTMWRTVLHVGALSLFVMCCTGHAGHFVAGVLLFLTNFHSQV